MGCAASRLDWLQKYNHAVCSERNAVRSDRLQPVTTNKYRFFATSRRVSSNGEPSHLTACLVVEVRHDTQTRLCPLRLRSPLSCREPASGQRRVRREQLRRTAILRTQSDVGSWGRSDTRKARRDE